MDELACSTGSINVTCSYLSSVLFCNPKEEGFTRWRVEAEALENLVFDESVSDGFSRLLPRMIRTSYSLPPTGRSSGDQEDLARAELSPPPAGGGPAPPQRLESEGGATKEKAFVALQTLMLTKENWSSSDPTVGSQPFVRSVVQESPSPRPPPPYKGVYLKKQRGGRVHSVVRMILCFLGGMVRRLAQMQVSILKLHGGKRSGQSCEDNVAY
ncbi:hypothetical protein C4D60_Mb03t12370 [Musa balbisiana]|uniref:Uncharacterized protein n=1 Tax=Musa balbisiana TaxID=52838 RepID=A0A4V4H621_MUSBA|nr:hypothetical protein C4D60_Mb03t12370 [Musa balbisiana]